MEKSIVTIRRREYEPGKWTHDIIQDEKVAVPAVGNRQAMRVLHGFAEAHQAVVELPYLAWDNVEKIHRYYYDGPVLRWCSNDRCVPLDVLEELRIPHHRHAQRKAIDIDTAATLAEYRQARKDMSEEQRAEELDEMRAAFGAGAQVVNIVTGETFNL